MLQTHSLEILEIFLPVRFYVKSILAYFWVSKSVILTILEAKNFEFGKFEQLFMAEIHKN